MLINPNTYAMLTRVEDPFLVVNECVGGDDDRDDGELMLGSNVERPLLEGQQLCPFRSCPFTTHPPKNASNLVQTVIF